jgi:hypothetical protein
MNSTPVAAVACAFLAGACSSLSTSFDYDTGFDFARLATYGWVDRQDNSLDLRRVREAVDAELAARGYRLVESRPDFQVAAHVSTSERIRIVDWGYTFHSRRHWYAGGRDIDVWQYDEGTLVLDVIDPGQSALVWRGTASKTIDRTWTPEERDAEARAGVQALLSRFPPVR